MVSFGLAEARDQFLHPHKIYLEVARMDGLVSYVKRVKDSAV